MQVQQNNAERSMAVAMGNEAMDSSRSTGATAPPKARRGQRRGEIDEGVHLCVASPGGYADGVHVCSYFVVGCGAAAGLILLPLTFYESRTLRCKP